MAIREPENAYTSAADSIAGFTGAYFFGLQGDDTFFHPPGGALVEYVGGSGNDHYVMGANPGLMSVYETSGTADDLTATGIGFSLATTSFVTIEHRHLFAFDTASNQGVLDVDWTIPAHRVETYTLADGTYSYDQFASALASDPRYRGDITWQQAVDAKLFQLPDGAVPADVDEAIGFYKNHGIALENPTFAWTNTQTGQSGTTAAPAYAGPVSYLDLQFLGSDGAEAVGGTAFSDFVNALGGDDAVSTGLGDDVLDGGTGSNFLTGGLGFDVFYLDGRGGQVTWGTITDWEAGEQLSLWGWRPGVSHATWVDSAGAEGFKGVTLHTDLDGNGSIDASVTWAGLTRAQLPTPIEFDGLLWFK